ncbi:MAG TPA: ABC transporter permease subunit [Chitinophagaceae bacterium]|nr:ABC transporter permease subunit [Chitinophagaceae bacterium]
MLKIIKYVMMDILRSRLVLGYTILLFVISLTVFNLEDNSSKGLLSLLNIILFIVPLVSIIFSTIYMYNSAEFIELLVSQPVRRKTLWLGLFNGLAVSLGLAFLLGIGIPAVIFQPTAAGFTLVAAGFMLSIVFVGLAVLSTSFTRDKARGIGLSVLLWLYFSIIFDGLVLFILFQFQDYPLEKVSIVLSNLNPVDLSRILILLQLDASALMGYTGAVFKDFFGTQAGIIISLCVLLLWVWLPMWLSVRRFNHKDL